MEKTKQLIAAVVTPMGPDGNINPGVIGSYAEFLIGRGVDGVFVNGTTGEGLLMDNDERKAIAEAWMPYADRLRIMVHVGSTSYKLSMDLAAHAEKIGAAAISAMGPCFLQPSRTEELVDFNREIAKAAPDTPYYFYNIPVASGCKADVVDFLTMAKDEIPTLKGVKYTSFNTMEEQEICALDGGRFDILHGHDELFLTGLILGASGGIGTSYNLTSFLYNDLIAAFESGDIAKAKDLQAEAIRFIHVMCDTPSVIAGIKAMMNIYGVDCGPVRLPLRNLTVGEMKAIEDSMKQFAWI
ncbi:MAG: dihydrodipicolinate synthase family protein [Bacteroidales bacterium]|nr:dihydrodipicolinate synthase family protein [Candidatus Cacconaster equifaecalis]